MNMVVITKVGFWLIPMWVSVSNMEDSTYQSMDVGFFHFRITWVMGDETFPLKLWLLRPYPGKNLTEEQYVYIYRHARARRVTENTFVILIAR